MSLDAFIGLALVVIVVGFAVGAVLMRGQPRRRPDRSSSGDTSGYAASTSPASGNDARDATDREPNRDPDATDPSDHDSWADDGGNDGGGSDGGGSESGGGGRDSGGGRAVPP